ncbi:beta propeller repeat protein, partial [Actinocorallia lasiicapitis]
GGPALADVELTDVAAASSEGPVVAVGSSGMSMPRPLFLVSYNAGASWARFEPSGTAGPSTPQSVAVGPHGWVALGSTYEPPPSEGRTVVWTSPDGAHWAQSRAEDTALFGRSGPLEVQATTAGFVALSGEVDPVGGQHVRLWFSPDGVRWEKARVPETVLSESGAAGGLAVEGGAALLPLTDGGKTTFLRSADGGRTWSRP